MHRDLESDREVRFVESHTYPTFPCLTSDRRAPKFNMAPTNREKSYREEARQRALEKGEQENTHFYDLALEFAWFRMSDGDRILDIAAKTHRLRPGSSGAAVMALWAACSKINIADYKQTTVRQHHSPLSSTTIGSVAHYSL